MAVGLPSRGASFSWWKDSPAQAGTTCIYLSGTLGLFPLQAVVGRAGMNSHGQVSVCTCFPFSGSAPSSGIAGSYENAKFNLGRNRRAGLARPFSWTPPAHSAFGSDATSQVTRAQTLLSFYHLGLTIHENVGTCASYFLRRPTA